MKTFLVGAILVLYAAVLAPFPTAAAATAATATGTTWERLRTGPAPEIGCDPPDFKLPAPDGTLMDIARYRGKVILLTFCSGAAPGPRRSARYILEDGVRRRSRWSTEKGPSAVLGFVPFDELIAKGHIEEAGIAPTGSGSAV